MPLLSSADVFTIIFFLKNSFHNTIRVSNGLDPDQVDVLVWVKTVFKDYKQTTKLVTSKEKIKKSKDDDQTVALMIRCR